MPRRGTLLLVEEPSPTFLTFFGFFALICGFTVLAVILYSIGTATIENSSAATIIGGAGIMAILIGVMMARRNAGKVYENGFVPTVRPLSSLFSLKEFFIPFSKIMKYVIWRWASNEEICGFDFFVKNYKKISCPCGDKESKKYKEILLKQLQSKRPDIEPETHFVPSGVRI